MSRTQSLKRALALSCACAFAVSACSSKGTTRVSTLGQTSSIEKAGPQGPQGEQGPAGPQGPSGPQGKQGEAGADGNLNLGAAGALATGGLIGPNGLAGTGLLAETGDPENSPELLSQGLILTGEQAQLAAGSAFYAASIVDGALPGSTALAGTVIGVADNTGQALVQAGNGEIYLVDGLTAAPGDLITASIGEATAIGGGDDSLLGLSVLSADQQDGSLVTLGVGSGGDLVTLDTIVTGDVTGGLEASGGVAETVGGVTEVLPVSTGGDIGGGLTGDLTGDLTDTVGGVLYDPTGTLDDTVDIDDGLVGGLLGNN